MNPDRLIHERKNFAELEDEDVESFLRERKFNTEHLGIEFKSSFPLTNSNRFKYQDICKYVIGFLNSEGGLIIYGVDNRIHDKSLSFPDYICGLSVLPSLEDLSEWAKNFIYPSTPSPSIRFFKVVGKDIVIMKVPSGVNKPYCFLNPSTKEISLFVKTSGGISILAPYQVREFFRSSIIEQSERIITAQREFKSVIDETDKEVQKKENERISLHQKAIRPKLEDIENFGYVAIYSYPDESLSIPFVELKEFMEKHRFSFSESLRYAPGLEFIQDGISAGYYPRSIRQDIRSTARTTVYTDGLVAFDSQADEFMDKDRSILPTWLSYEIQRHLQLSKAILEKHNIEEMNVYVDFDFMNDFSLTYTDRFLSEKRSSKYQGHQPIKRRVAVPEIHSFDGPERNIVFPTVRSILDEISRIFGFSETPQICWDKDGYLTFVRGLEHTR